MKDRFLNILLVSFVFLLALNLFLPKPAKVVEANEPTFVLSKASVVVPNYPVVTLKNTSDTPIVFNTCADLTILKDLKTVKIDATAQSFCRNMSVAAKSE